MSRRRVLKTAGSPPEGYVPDAVPVGDAVPIGDAVHIVEGIPVGDAVPIGIPIAPPPRPSDERVKRENEELRARLRSADAHKVEASVLKARLDTAEGQKREGEMWRARAQMLERRREAFDSAVYNRIYTELLDYIPLEYRLKISSRIGDLARTRLIAGLPEAVIIREMRDMIEELLRKQKNTAARPRKASSKKKPRKASSKKKPRKASSKKKPRKASSKKKGRK
jgi:hypothetical protein